MILTAASARCCECALPLACVDAGSAWSSVRCASCGTRLQVRRVPAGYAVRLAVPECAPLQPVAPPAARRRFFEACRRVVSLIAQGQGVEPGMAEHGNG